jgi:hypothetical protein
MATHPRRKEVTAKILVITPPDDTVLQGLRITHVNLTNEQTAVVSQAILKNNLSHNVINYVWHIGNPISWLLQMKSKSNLIIFNADSDTESDMITGYLAADPRSYYFGTLRDLHVANDRVILNSDEILNLLETIAKYHV